MKNNNEWIQPNVIEKMSDDELKEKYLEYYKGAEGRQPFNQIHRDRIIRDTRRFREEIMYLLNEEINIEERMEQILNGENHIKGFY